MLTFVADMGVSLGVVDHLRALGADVLCLSEARLHRLADVDIFLRAADEGRVVLTFDLDFGEILALSGGAVVSVVLFRLNDTTTPFVIRRLNEVLADASDALRDGAIVVVEDTRHRIRRLPL